MTATEQLSWFQDMVTHALEYAEQKKREGRPVVGIMCEFTPRELIMAAGGVPVCLCGGCADTIPAAETVLPSNLCPLIKSTYGFSLAKENPFLEMADLVVAETTCDGKKKMCEIMARERPVMVLELPQKPDDPDAFEHWVQELRKLRAFLAGRFNVPLSDESIRSAIRSMNHERSLRLKLAELMKSDDPPLTGRELLDLKSLVSCIPEDIAHYESLLDALPGRKVLSGAKPVRVLVTGVPHPHGAEKVMDLIESNGGLVVCQENCTGVKPVLENVDERASDPLRAIAAKYFHLPCSVMTPNARRMKSIEKLAGEYRADCVVDVIWQSCLTYAVESVQVRQLAENELRLPYLKLETDYSPSDTARISVRLQALFETIRSRKGAA